MSDNASIKERIRKLRDRTVARGCSEAEAATALGKAAQLMAEHGLTEADLVMGEAACRRPTTETAHPRDLLMHTVAACTGTVAMRAWHGRWIFVFHGRAPFPEIAAYTLDMLDAAVSRAVREYQKTTHYKRKRTLKAKSRATRSFTQGLVARLCRQLVEHFGGPKPDEQRGAKRYRDSLGLNLGDVRSIDRGHRRDDGAAGRGYEAGGDIVLADGLARDEAAGAIGAGPRLIGRM